MATVSKLKDKARLLEQQKKWKDALDTYQQLADESEGEDSGLWNRIGDLHLRLGQTEPAVDAYEHAVETYVEAGLLNNAIALCNKMLRAAPARLPVYLKLGQISAAQGFLADARHNFRQYAERTQKAGRLDESFAALREFADLSPQDTDARRLLADQLRSHDRTDEALEQLRLLLGQLEPQGRDADAAAVRDEILAIDPHADLAALAGARVPGPRAHDRGLDLLPTFETSPGSAGAVPDTRDEADAPEAAGIELSSFHIEASDSEGERAEVSSLDGLEPTQRDDTLDAEGAGVEEPMFLDIQVGDDEPDAPGDSFALTENAPAGADPFPDIGEVGDEELDFNISSAPDTSDASPLEGFESTLQDGPWEADEDGWEQDQEEGGGALPLFGTSAEPDAAPAMDEVTGALGEAASALLEDDDMDSGADIPLPLLSGDGGWEDEAEAETSGLPAPSGDLDPIVAADERTAESAIGEVAAVVGVLDGAHRALAADDRYTEAADVVREQIELQGGDTALFQKQVEYAFRSGDRDRLIRAYLDLGHHLESSDNAAKSIAVYQRVLELDPENAGARNALMMASSSASTDPRIAHSAPAGSGYVDLAALIFDDEVKETSTRFIVPEDEPTGDEDRDFADMLSRFRQKVAENIGVEDTSSHYDLGLAFRDMGLIDEAIAQFQVALRGGSNPLATLEVLGECFVDKGQFSLASRVLDRALRLPGVDEQNLVGIYYWIARCDEVLGHTDGARENFERVLSLDLRFRDAASRLDTLRTGGE